MICINVVDQINEPNATYEHACRDCGCALILHNRSTGLCCLHTAVEGAVKPAHVHQWVACIGTRGTQTVEWDVCIDCHEETAERVRP